MNENILKEIKDSFEKNLIEYKEIAKKNFDAVEYNLQYPEHGAREEQIEGLIEYLNEFKKETIFDLIQGNVLRDFTDGDICELEEYEETCEIVTDYELELNDYIDELISSARYL